MTADPVQVSSVGTHQADALAGARRRHGEDVLGAVVAQVGVVEQAEHDAARRQQAGAAHVANVRPAGRAVRRFDCFGSAPPGGSPDGDQCGCDATGERQETGAAEHLGCLCVEGDPPGEQLPRRIDGDAAETDPRRAQCRLMPEHACCPLRRRPHEAKCQKTQQWRLAGSRLRLDDIACFPRAHDTPHGQDAVRSRSLVNWDLR